MNFRFSCLGLIMGLFIGLTSAVASDAPVETKKPILPLNPVYQEMTYSSMFRLAWVMDAVNPKNDEAIDSYLMVAECDLYKKFFANEFGWEKIRTATRKYLTQYASTHSPYYEYVQQLPLGRYDNQLEGFPVENPQNYKGLRVLQMASYDVGETKCQRFSIDSYKFPSAAAIQLVSPFNLTFFRVPLDAAKNYLAWREEEKMLNKGNRIAYIKYRVRIDKFLGIRRVEAQNAYFFAGRLMQIDIYADQAMLRPLYNQAY